MAGFIVIDRKIRDWKWWGVANAMALWLHILVNANWKDGFFMGEPIPRGSFVTSLPKLSDETGMSESTIRRWLKRFEDDGQIEQKVTNKYRVIKVLNYSAYQDIPDDRVNSQVTGQMNSQVTGQVNSQVNSQVTPNRTIITIEQEKQGNKGTKLYTVESKTVIDLLNRKTGKSFRYSESNLKHIRARFSEGAKMEDFETVIDRKYKQWHGTDMAKFLRPETLFGSKFDSYLNEGDEKTLTISDPGYYSGEGEW